MTNDLQFLIDAARQYKMTKEEQQAQVKSFAFGNTHMENSLITREDIDTAMNSLQAERDLPVHT